MFLAIRSSFNRVTPEILEGSKTVGKKCYLECGKGDKNTNPELPRPGLGGILVGNRAVIEDLL